MIVTILKILKPILIICIIYKVVAILGTRHIFNLVNPSMIASHHTYTYIYGSVYTSFKKLTDLIPQNHLFLDHDPTVHVHSLCLLQIPSSSGPPNSTSPPHLYLSLPPPPPFVYPLPLPPCASLPHRCLSLPPPPPSRTSSSLAVSTASLHLPRPPFFLISDDYHRRIRHVPTTLQPVATVATTEPPSLLASSTARPPVNPNLIRRTPA